MSIQNLIQNYKQEKRNYPGLSYERVISDLEKIEKSDLQSADSSLLQHIINILEDKIQKTEIKKSSASRRMRINYDTKIQLMRDFIDDLNKIELIPSPPFDPDVIELRRAYLVEGTKVHKGVGFEISTYYFSNPDFKRRYFRKEGDSSFKISKSGITTNTITFSKKEAKEISKNRKRAKKIEAKLDQPKIQGSEREFLQKELKSLKVNL